MTDIFYPNPRLPFGVTAEVVMSNPGFWSYELAKIYKRNEPPANPQLVGSFVRNYGCYARETFHPFEHGDAVYALYSPRYTGLRLMDLSSPLMGLDVGGEVPSSFGFCPREVWVPDDPRTGKSAAFGFVAGCVWGDDSTDKVELLDLRDASLEELTRIDVFGRIHLNGNLRDAIEFEWDKTFEFEGRTIDWLPGMSTPGLSKNPNDCFEDEDD